jgi:alpha-glucosidase
VTLPEPSTTGETWWRSGVLYEVYPRSFADSDGDGVGDLQGVLDRLEHLAWLGVDGIWLNPTTPSPNADWGYDVSDYTSVDPELGDLETLDRLVAEAGARGIRILLDLVPNHTSDRHPWFLESRSSMGSPRRDWYVWADGRDGLPPNNWRSVFGGPAWTWDGATGQYYLHNFLPEQPDLNWWNEQVREAFDDVLRFWFGRGVAGFRIDVANGVVKDPELRDNPPVTEDDHPLIRALGLRPVYNMNRPEVHEVIRRWRRVSDAHDPPAILLGETWVPDDLRAVMRFYGDGADELHLAMNFAFVFAELGAETRAVVEAAEASMPAAAWPVWTGSNHDVGRLATRWCGGDERKIRAAILILLTLRGTPILYAGDEIGMPDVDVPRARLRDPVGLRGGPEAGRDRCRTPMQWTRDRAGGFTRPGVEPWLPMGDADACNVADQREDPGSVLHLCHDLIGVRRARADMRAGAYETLGAPPGAWTWRRGAHTIVALNHSEGPLEVPVGPGEVLVGTRRERDGELVGPAIRLDPWEGVVVGERATD